jgi:hypothetical protein
MEPDRERPNVPGIRPRPAIVEVIERILARWALCRLYRWPEKIFQEIQHDFLSLGRVCGQGVKPRTAAPFGCEVA